MDDGLRLDRIIKKNEPLAKYCSYNIGGHARFLALPRSLGELDFLINCCQKSGLRPYFFGLGSNILFPDNPDPDTLFVSLKNMVDWSETNGELFLQAGFPLSFLAYTGFPGLSFTHLLPGTLGASIYMNARCYEGEVSQILKKVYFLDLTDFGAGIKELEREGCCFAYKESIFQERPWVILGADVETGTIVQEWWKKEVQRVKELNLSSLDAFFQFFGKTLYSRTEIPPAQKEKLQRIAADREGKKQFSYPSCGSVFKNNYEYGVPTGILVEQVGLKGVSRGGAKISPFHGNFIINFNRATSADVKYLINVVQEKINEKFGFIPEPEVVIIHGQED